MGAFNVGVPRASDVACEEKKRRYMVVEWKGDEGNQERKMHTNHCVVIVLRRIKTYKA